MKHKHFIEVSNICPSITLNNDVSVLEEIHVFTLYVDIPIYNLKYLYFK